MQFWLIALFAAAGISVGVLQVWLLSRLLFALTAKNYAAAVLPLFAKTVVYALAFTVVVLLFKDCIIPFGAGVGGGMAVAAFVYAAFSVRRTKE